MKFSIRDLLLVTVIVALVATWAIDHQRQAREIKELKEQLEEGEEAWMKGGGFF
jgi:preprotein translocase subunit YajC